MIKALINWIFRHRFSFFDFIAISIISDMVHAQGYWWGLAFIPWALFSADVEEQLEDE